MTTPLTSQPPTQADVLEAIRETVANGRDEYGLPDFLASIDWSVAVRPPSEVAAMLGRLELWDSEYREGDMDWAEFVGRLDSLAEGVTVA